MTSDDYIKAQLSSLMWRAASGISFPAMVAVGLCVRNRVTDGNWLATLDKIDAGNEATGVDCADARDPKFQEVLVAVDGIYDGTRVDRWTNGGTHWHETGQPLPAEFAGRLRLAQVGTLEIWT